MVTWTALLLCLIAGVVAEAPASVDAEANATGPARGQGFWPSPEMVELGMKRTAAHAAERYDLSNEQQLEAERRLLRRWSRFLRKHETELRPLVNEFYNARLGAEPPGKELVAGWAKRARPIWTRIEREVAAGNDEFERILTLEQQQQFAHDRKELEENLRKVQRTLDEWRRGEFDRRIWWEKAREQELRSASTGPPAGRSTDSAPVVASGDEIDLELDAWARYVSDFCEAHDLDTTQRRAAESILTELVARAKGHRDRHWFEIAVLDRLIADPSRTTEEEVARRVQDLYGPIDAMFQELATRLDRIPTNAQKRRAKATSQPSTSPTE